MTITTTWQEALKDVSPYPALSQNITTDVCIIGGGIAGTTTAYLLAKKGKKVVVIDKGILAESVTAYTTAFLTSTIDTDLTDFQKMFGTENLKLMLESHEDAIDMIESIAQEEKIDCEFMRVSEYEVALSKKGMEQLKADAHISNSVGQEVTIISKGRFPFEYVGASESPEQAKFHPTKYLLGVRAAAEKLGVQFFEHTEAKDIQEHDGKDKQIITLANGKTIAATDVVIATYNSFKQPWWYIFKKGMYITYVYEVEIQKGVLPEALFEDDNNPYFYYRIDAGKGPNGKDRMIIGGVDHRKEIPFTEKSGFAAIDTYIKDTLGIADSIVVKKWSGPILEQTDGIAYIGRVSPSQPHRYGATGFSGNGMTYGTLSGIIISDLITGKKNKYEELYRPYRHITLSDIFRKGRDYIDELFHGILQHRTKGKKQ